ncbi:MAG TPA: hypothetical protein VMZ69_10780, partial [Saprospiraceae bacterium]|nr:hypothetical protein [Saprospiraceae bacterium]
MKSFPLLVLLILYFGFFSFQQHIFSQNKVGLGTVNPQARLHIKGEDNISQLCIDADTQQTNLSPLIRLRKSDGTDLMWIHSNIPENIFIGLNSGQSITNGGYNTAVGKYALKENTSGDYNSAFGANALLSNTTGITNTAIGSGT